MWIKAKTTAKKSKTKPNQNWQCIRICNWHLTIATNYISSCTRNHTAHGTNLNIIIIGIWTRIQISIICLLCKCATDCSRNYLRNWFELAAYDYRITYFQFNWIGVNFQPISMKRFDLLFFFVWIGDNDWCILFKRDEHVVRNVRMRSGEHLTLIVALNANSKNKQQIPHTNSSTLLVGWKIVTN